MDQHLLKTLLSRKGPTITKGLKLQTINLFYLHENSRERILFENGVYLINNTDITFSKEEILKCCVGMVNTVYPSFGLPSIEIPVSMYFKISFIIFTIL